MNIEEPLLHICNTGALAVVTARLSVHTHCAEQVEYQGSCDKRHGKLRVMITDMYPLCHVYDAEKNN
jgi:hypothetical protein